MIESFEKYEAIILAVSHDLFSKIDFDDLKSSTKSIIFDVKGVLNREIVNGRL
jgi:UDP-N-acetyl-D-galactosamine dehydrogenase